MPPSIPTIPGTIALGRQVARRRLAEITDQVRLINAEPENYSAAWARLEEYADQPLSLFDTVLAAMSGRLGLQIWTFDHHFDVLRAAVWRPGA